MEMEGSIEEFAVPEVVQFLSLHEADGVLLMKSMREEVSFGLKKGKIAAAAYKGEDFFHSINEYIIRIGKVSEEELIGCTGRAKELDLSVFQVLLQEDKIRAGDLREIISFKIQEIMDEVLTWKTGRYSFDAGKVLYRHSTVSVELDPNALVMEGMRRIDEWPQIRSVLPGDNVALRGREKPEITVELGNKERKILEKFSDGITVGELVKTVGLGKFQTYNAVYKLIEIGLLERVEEGVKGTEIEIDKRIIRKYRVPFKAIFKKVLLIGFILFNLFFFVRFKLDKFEDFISSVKNVVQRVDKY